jgi:DNA invertase Pin-like site-specific DNA recombinase
MAEGRFVAYFRVSTAKQGRSGLGLEAQKAAVLAFLNGGSWTLLEEFVEIESGKLADRPELARALAACRLTGAKLVIAKLDRLSRDAHFLLGLQRADVGFVAADMPEANELTVGIMAVVAQAERKAISERTKAALAAAKVRRAAKGQPPLGGYRGGPPPDSRLGISAKQARANAFAMRLAPTLAEMRHQGLSLHQIAAALSARSILAPQNGAWTATAVRRVLARVAKWQGC